MSLPYLILRLGLSLVMLAIFAIALYQAYKYFTGNDPLKQNPQQFITSLVTSQGSASIIHDLLSFKFPNTLKGWEDLAKDPKNYLDKHPSDIAIPSVDTPTPERILTPTLSPSGNRILRFALVADSHVDNVHLQKALAQAKDAGAKFVIGLGDYSDVGTIAELQNAYQVFVSSGLPFYVTAGDHDLWDPRNRGIAATTNFNQVFGTPYQSFGDSNIRFIILYNSDNYLGVDSTEMDWLKEELDQVKNNHPLQTFVFVHEPLYHPSSDHYMGKDNASVRNQAKTILSLLKDAGVGGVFAGDVHYFSQYEDPQTRIPMTVVGAVTDDRNTQSPRFAIVDVYQNGAYNVADTEIK